MDRQKYNSQSLKEEFKDIYRDFFATCVTVASAPASFMWVGNYLVMFGSPGIKQNLPLRTYVGLEEMAGSKITISKTLNFIPNKRVFKNYILEENVEQELVSFLKVEIEKLTGKPFKGLKIKILSEVQAVTGINASGSLSCALASAIFLHYKKITPSEIAAWAEKNTEQLISDQKFNLIFRLAWKFETIFHGGITSGIGAFAPFIASRSPIVYFTERQITKKDEIHLSWDIGDERNYNLIDSVKYVGFRLEEMIAQNGKFSFPFDFCLINSGWTQSTIVANRIVKEITHDLEETVNFYHNDFTRYLKQKNYDVTPYLDNQLEFKKIGKYWDSYILVAVITALNIFKTLIKINGRSAPLDLVRFLFRNLNDYQNILRIFYAYSPHVDYLVNFLHHEVGKIEDEYGLGIKSTTTGRGGYVLCTMASYRLRDELPEIIKKFNQKKGSSGGNVSLDWSSWHDGLEGKGVIVEQDLTNQIYSPFITRGSMQVLHFDKYGLHDDLYTLDEFENLKKKMDVVLDSLRHEIWVRGEKLTSKELKTASNTIAAFKVLLNNVRQEIPKTKLPQSGYLQDRNEFQSKIVSPIVRAIEKRLGRRIDFNVKGKIVNFTVNFDPKDVEFYLIKKEF